MRKDTKCVLKWVLVRIAPAPSRAEQSWSAGAELVNKSQPVQACAGLRTVGLIFLKDYK